MKKLIIIFILFISFSVHGESRMDSALRVNRERQLDSSSASNLDRGIKNMDTTIQYGKEIVKIYKEEIKTYGLKKTIQINAPILLPVVIFIILFLLWLKGRDKA